MPRFPVQIQNPLMAIGVTPTGEKISALFLVKAGKVTLELLGQWAY